MIYLQKTNKKRKPLLFPISIVITVLVVATIFQLFIPTFFGGIAQAIARPIFYSDNFVSHSLASFVGFLRSRKAIIDENRELKANLETAELLILQKDILTKENNELKALLGRINPKDTILGSVLSRPPRSPYDVLIIDAGTEESVQQGDAVLAPGDIVLGKIVEVYAHTSKAQLYSTAGEVTEVIVERTNIPVEVTGQGGGSFAARVPREVDIVKGDILIMPGISKKILGIVGEIESSPKDSFQEVFIKSPVNMSMLVWALINRNAN